MYPPKLNKIIDLFETLPEVERRETLVNVTAGCVAIASLEPKVPDPS